jgi:transcriptional regulator with XRE-family HTH domain
MLKELVMEEQLCLFTAEDVNDLADWQEMAEQGVACVPPRKVIAQFVRWSRQVLQWKKQALASLASVSLSTVERIERGEQVSTESLERVAGALNQSKGAFTEPRVPLGSKATLNKFEEYCKQFEEKQTVSVRPLQTLPQVAELVRTDMYVVDGGRLGDDLREVIAELCEWLDFGSFMIGTEEDPIFDTGRRERVRLRWIYRKILDQAREVERRGGAVALAGVYEAEPNITTIPKVRVAVVSFFPNNSDPAARKRRFLLAPARIDVLAAFQSEENHLQQNG